MADVLPGQPLYNDADVQAARQAVVEDAVAGASASGTDPAVVRLLAENGWDEEDVRLILDAAVPGILARHLEELAASHDATAARTDHRISPGAKATSRAFARHLRRHIATLERTPS